MSRCSGAVRVQNTQRRATATVVQLQERGKAVSGATEGTSDDSREIAYEGVSILEIKGQIINRFYAYFDPAHLGEQIADS